VRLEEYDPIVTDPDVELHLTLKVNWKMEPVPFLYQISEAAEDE